MAEFVQTMNDWRRMCKAYSTDDDSCCEGCPIIDFREHGCGAIFEMEDGTDWQRYSNAIMSWAAEHPEPVYPTWADYISTLVIKDICTGKISGPDTVLTYAMKTHIPADIAQKLGLEPKYTHDFVEWLARTGIPADIVEKLGIEPKDVR